MNYYIIKINNKINRYISIEDESGVKVLAKKDSSEWRCLNKMLRKESVILITEKHPWYDFADILFNYMLESDI